MYKIKYEKFRATVWKGGVMIKGFSCYLTEHSHKLAREFVEQLKK